MAATIRDVAQRAGVSKATVSYILNGRESPIRITDETRQRVLQAAQELHYHPNALARGLTQKRTDTITLVMQFPAIFSGWSGFTNEVMRGATETAIRLGYDLMLHTKEQPTIEQEVAALTDGRADGALLLRDMDDPLAERLAQRGFPCVLFSSCANPDIWFVDCDNIAGGRMATEYLLKLGHHRILHLCGSPHSSAAAERRAGYEQALRDHQIDPRPDWIVEVTYPGASYAAVEALLRAPDRPTAAFAWSDEVAVRLMTLAREMGLRIPEDLSIIGFDSTDLCNHTTPPLTSVRQPIYDMAAQAVTLLAQRLSGVVPEQRQIRYRPELNLRRSCRRCAV